MRPDLALAGCPLRLPPLARGECAPHPDHVYMVPALSRKRARGDGGTRATTSPSATRDPQASNL